ncbi:PBSX family phage terminase large subunit [Litorihabitans aurantiacus]|uniref:Phage terminase large subunit n=1 Tax=Litorihabitans aurantiacus TaxID=1930061 RepID=A0AA37XE86_9MICO|nr:phage terminase large subunit [Litorihabitans aurantiacus]GMA31591.1 phage terminase large subunit [Litorihabitans aurantiacus]
MTLSTKQLASVRDATGTVNLWHGSIRAGKTIGSLIRWSLFVANAPTGGELVMVGRTRDAVWRNVIGPLQDPAITGAAAAYVVGNYGAPTVTMFGRRVHVLGASDAKAELVIRGMTVAGVYVDEVTTLPEQFFTQLLGRMSVRGAKMFGTTNPDNPAHWLKRKFIDRGPDLPHWRVFHFTMDDNPSLTREYVEQKKLEFTGLWYRRFILGEWVAAEGAIYAGWNPARHVIRAADLPAMIELISVGVDHGMTNPSAGLLIGLGEDRRLYTVDEWWLDASTIPGGVTVATQSTHLRAWLNGRRVRHVVVDPAAAALRVQLSQDGVTGLVNADNDVAYGIPLVASLLGQGHLVVSDACTNLIREIPGYSWDPKKTEKGEDAPIKVADHALDAWRYGLVTTERLWRPALAPPAALAA